MGDSPWSTLDRGRFGSVFVGFRAGMGFQTFDQKLCLGRVWVLVAFDSPYSVYMIFIILYKTLYTILF